MGKVILIGGGPEGGEFDIKLENEIYELQPKKSPVVYFVPYGDHNYEENYLTFRNIYETFNCNVQLLQPGLEEDLLQADIIYFGRGGTIPLIDKLRETGAIPYLQQAHQKGAMLVGFSAGANALCDMSVSYEENVGFTLVQGLGFIQACLMTHYNYNERKTAFHKLIENVGIIKVGLEDHTMLMVENGIGTVIRSQENSNVFKIEKEIQKIDQLLID